MKLIHTVVAISCPREWDETKMQAVLDLLSGEYGTDFDDAIRAAVAARINALAEARPEDAAALTVEVY